MLEQPKRVQLKDPIEQTFDEIFEESFEDRFDEPYDQPSGEQGEPPSARYHENSRERFEETSEDNIARPLFARARHSRPFTVVSEESIPLFLSGRSGQGRKEEPDEDIPEPPPEEVKRVLSPRVLKVALLAACASGIIFGLFAVEDTRAVIANAKASLAGEAPFSALPSRNPVPTLPPKIQAALADRPTASTAPTREQIVMAYHAALQGQTQDQQNQSAAPMQQVVPPFQIVQPDPPAPTTSPAARRLEADELANLLKRAKGLLAIGDVSAARLLLARAADAQEAEAALLLARSYDPQVLRSSDARTTSPDPEQARFWYGKAAEFGSPDAQRRLAELQQ